VDELSRPTKIMPVVPSTTAEKHSWEVADLRRAIRIQDKMKTLTRFLRERLTQQTLHPSSPHL
jgi:hypothetical protein